MSEKPTPETTHNRPGLPAVERRVGRYRSIRTSLMQSLSSRHRLGLKPLTTRDPQDWTIAFLDAFAQVGDTLTFYQERISNESYLGTATETLSVQQIAALVDYRPAPATAAHVYLAFSMDDTLPFTGVFDIPAGVAVKSIPIQEELPQTYETLIPLRAKATWNEIRPAQFYIQNITQSSKTFYLNSNSPSISRGDPIIFLSGDTPASHNAAPKIYVCFAARVLETGDGAARIDLSRTSNGHVDTVPLILPEADNLTDLKAGDVTRCLDLLKSYRWNRNDIQKAQNYFGLSVEDLTDALSWDDPQVSPNSLKPTKLNVRARLFGHNALPAPYVLNASGTAVRAYTNPTYVNNVYANLGTQTPSVADSTYLYLDRKYETIIEGDIAIIRGRAGSANVEEWVEISEVDAVSVSGYGQSAEVTRIRIASKTALRLNSLKLRSVEIFTGSEALELATRPILDPVGQGSTIDTDNIQLLCEGTLLDLAIGQSVALSALRLDLPGASGTELLKIADIALHGTHTALSFSSPFNVPYLRSETKLNANVVLASHGETVTEVIGSGDGTKAHQKFHISRKPLTYLPAKTMTGRAPVLEIRVNDMLWDRVESLANAKPSDRVYTVETIGAGASKVQFGNGKQGARLPTGENNINAVYRVGAGLGGLVQPGQLTLLSRKPMGVQFVTNPQSAFGGSAAETREQARANVPVKGLTLGRIVSLADYKNFARAFGGITKAHASWGWSQENRIACVTVASEDGQPLPETDGILPLLRTQMSAVSPPGGSVIVKNFQPISVAVIANVFLDPNVLPSDGSTDQVFEAIRIALATDFGFARQVLGAPIRLAEMAAAIQSVAGVIAVDIDALHRMDMAQSREEIVRAYRPLQGEMGLSRGVELLTVTPEHIQLRVAT